LDASVFVAALKADEEYSKECADTLRRLAEGFVLAEPSVVYQEVCGTLARRVGLEAAREAERFLDSAIHPSLLFECAREFCRRAYPLCREYGVYSVDALYLRVALDVDAALVSLDERDFVARVRRKNPLIEVYHVSEFPY